MFVGRWSEKKIYMKNFFRRFAPEFCNFYWFRKKRSAVIFFFWGVGGGGSGASYRIFEAVRNSMKIGLFGLELMECMGLLRNTDKKEKHRL